MNIVKRQSDPVVLVRAPVVGLYAWFVAVDFGLAWLDIQYASLLPGAVDVFSEVADFLLFVMFVTTLAGIGAVGLSWKARVPRNLLAASLLILLVAPFVALVILSPEARQSPATGSVVRLSISGVASVLAFAGFHRIGRGG